MKKVTKKVYAIILIILMLLNYMPIIATAVEESTEATGEGLAETTATGSIKFDLESTAYQYDVDDEILIDLKVAEIKDLGNISEYISDIVYTETDLEFLDVIVNDSNYGSNSSIENKRIVISTTKAPTIGEGDIVCTLKFRAKKSSDTTTTVKLSKVDATCGDTGDVWYEDGNVNEPEITLPVKRPIIPHNLKITKTDVAGNAITSNSALFKVQKLDGECAFVETNEDGSLVIEGLTMPTSEGPFTYIIEEIVAPMGYIKNENQITINITFDEQGKVTITEVTNGEATVIEESNTIDVKISNEAEPAKPKQEEFSLILNKVDEKGQSIVTDTAEFIISLPDGTTHEVSTDTETGKTNKISVVAPETAGVYTYLIKETKSPEGYITEPFNIIVELTYEEQENKIVLTSGKIVSYDDEEVVPLVEETEKILTLNIKNEQEIVTYNYEINIDKVKNDTFKSPIREDKAIFEITKDEETQYIKTNELGKATLNFSMTNKEIEEGREYTYTVKEVKAPEGYVLDETPKTITVTFNANGSINTANVTGENIEKLAVNSNMINVNITNEEKEVVVPSTPENFNLVINKVDEEGNIIVTDEATFVLTKPDGTMQSYTTTNGVINDIELIAPTTAEKQVYFIQETKAPEGYEILNESLVIEMNYADGEGKIAINNVTIKGNEDEIILPTTENEVKTVTINIKNSKKEEINETKTFNIQLNGVDRDGNPIESGTTVIKLTDKTTNEYIYKEVSIENGIIQLEMPASEGTKQYEIEQIKAPEGYETNSNKITIELEFVKNASNELEISDYTVEGVDAEKGTTLEPNTASVIIVNDEKEVEPLKQEYSIEINKLDAETNELITESPATFTVIFPNTEVEEYSTTDGKIAIENLIPEVEKREVIYVIKEKLAPEGYEAIEKSVVVKVTFEEQEGTIVAKNAEVLLGQDVATTQMIENTIQVNITNEKEAQEEDLYVVSKKYEDGEDIYNLYNSYAGAHYSIENPFIDTKVAKRGNNVTVQEFINNLESNGVLTVWDLGGNQIANSEKVKTKMILKATKGEQKLTYTIVIKGDSDGDGRVRSKDLNMLIMHLSAKKVITSPIELRALDLTTGAGDGRVRSNDLNMYYNILAQ